MRKIIIKLAIIFISILIVSYCGSCFYIESHKKELITQFESAFAEHCNGEITFSDITLSSWTKFPAVFFEIKDLEFISFQVDKHKEEVIKTKNASVRISLAKLIRKKIEVKSIFIKDAVVELITNIDTTKTKALSKIITPKKSLKTLPLESSVNLHVENLHFSIINYQKNKKFRFKVNGIKANLNIEEDLISGKVTMNTQVNDLAFNTKAGSFFNGATVIGTLKPTIDLKNKKVNIPSFDLKIDDQSFKISSEMNLVGAGDFVFTIENEETHHSKTLALIPVRIQKKLKDYAVEEPLYTHTTIQGSFGPKSNPIVDIKFRSENNKARIKDNISLEEIDFSGRFVNRIYDDERAKTEHPKNSRLLIEAFKGSYKGLYIQLKEASLLSTPAIKTAVKGTLTSTGSPEQLNSILGSDTFFFKDGTYDLKAELDGDATYIDSLISKSKVSVNVRNTNMVKPKGNLQVPIRNLSLDIYKNNASLKTLEIELPSKDKIDISGEIKNVGALVNSESKDQVSSDLKIHANKLIWDSFSKVLNATKGNKKVEKKNKHSFQETLKDIYVKFNPAIHIDIEALDYKSLQIKRFKTGVHYKNRNSLYLENTSFDFGTGNVQLSGNLNIEKPNYIVAEAKVHTKGATDNLNTIFNTKDFIFKEGTFDLKANVKGDLKHIDKLLAKANSTILVKDASILLASKKLNIPINVLDVEIKDNKALLNKLQIGLVSGDKIDFKGKLENIDALLGYNTVSKVNTALIIHSKKLAWNDFESLFHKDKNAPKKQAKKALTETLKDLYTSFNPRVQVNIEDFTYNETVQIQDFKTGIHFEDFNHLKLEETSFTYDKNAFVNLSARLNITDPKTTFIEASFKAKGLAKQLNKILKNDNFIFNQGTFSLQATVKGDINKVDHLIANANSVLKFNDTKVSFKEAVFSIPELEVDILKNDAVLKTLKIDFESGNRVSLSGEVDNLSTILFDKKNSPAVKSELHIHSENLDFDDFTHLFKDKNKVKKAKDKQGLHASLHHVYHQFNPSFTVNVDTFKYENLAVENFKTAIHFEAADKIFLEDTGFDYDTGNVNLNAHIDIAQPKETLFALKFNTSKVNLEKLLNSFDNFGVAALKDADKIDGKISLDAFLEGSIHEGSGFESENLKGQIAFDLEDIELRNFRALTSVTDKIFKKERFEDIRFAPIKDVLYISNNTVEIPQFEIQSTAIDFFIEGHLGLKDKGTNIWVSVPLKNLQHRDVVDIPDKKGYIDAGKKVFVEIASENDEKATYKLHLNNKKLYEQKHILGQYKKKHKEEGHLRRKHRRADRNN